MNDWRLPSCAFVSGKRSDADPIRCRCAEYMNSSQTEGRLPERVLFGRRRKTVRSSQYRLPRQIDAIAPLWERSRDLRLFVLRRG